ALPGHFVHQLVEGRRRTRPAQGVDVVEQCSVRAQRRELLEQHRSVSLVAQSIVGKGFDGAMAFDQSRRGLRTNAGKAGVAIGAVADEREVVGNASGNHAELLAYAVRVADLAASSDDLHDAIRDHALREVLIRRPDRHLLHDGRSGHPSISSRYDGCPALSSRSSETSTYTVDLTSSDLVTQIHWQKPMGRTGHARG